MSEQNATPAKPIASIVIPTRARPDYLDVALGSVVPQATAAGAEVVVVSDGADPATDAVAGRYRAMVVKLPDPQGVNGARNAGVQAARGDLIVLLDDDVDVPPGWLETMLQGIASNPGYEVFGGPIRGRLEGGGLRACGREPPPISTYDFGSEDREVPYVYGGNTAIRRSAFERVGYFDASLSGMGDEEEWVRRYKTSGGRIRYVSGASLDHRRAAADARLGALTRAAYRRGREVWRHDASHRHVRSIRGEMRILAGCAWHTVRRRCAYGVVMGARAAGSLREALGERWSGTRGRGRAE